MSLLHVWFTLNLVPRVFLRYTLITKPNEHPALYTWIKSAQEVDRLAAIMDLHFAKMPLALALFLQ